jgi:hypothetical protein
MHKCSKCNLEKDLNQFHKRSNRPCGVRSICKECYKVYPKILKSRLNYMREYDLMKSYNITIQKYNEMLLNQNGKCGICQRDYKTLIGRKKFLCVDHNHKTNQVRGLLCDKCNRGIGMFNDCKDLLIVASEYLNKYH